MSYAAAIDHLLALTPELSPTAPRRKFDLAHMRTLARALGDPQSRFPSILIAGTNGKGSTAATLASILTAAGYRTGLYTSPHLTRPTERIRVSQPATKAGAPRLASETWDVPPQTLHEIPEPTFARLYFHVDATANRLVAAGELPHPPSFFETLTALAFLYFAEVKIDIAVLEVGLGGRLDATNIVAPILSIITDIALDHQDYLGSTIAEIAREKAGILRPNGTLITLPQHPDANQAIGEAAIALNTRAISAVPYLPNRDAVPTRTALEGQSPEGEEAAVILSEGVADAESKHLPSGSHQRSSPDISAVEPADVLAAASRYAKPSGLALSGPPEIGALAPEVVVRPGPLAPNHYTLHLDNQPLPVRSPLAGEHQRRNLALAIAAAVELRNQHSYNIPNAAIEAGIANTSWPGRLEFLPPNLLLDVAHNPAGAWTLRAAISSLPEQRPRTLIFSCLRDKDLTEISRILFPLFDTSGPSHSTSNLEPTPLGTPSLQAWVSQTQAGSEARSPRLQPRVFPGARTPPHQLILTPIDNPRAASLDSLLAAAAALSIPAHAAHSPTEALALARSLTPPDGLILATGSIFLIGALRTAALAPQLL